MTLGIERERDKINRDATAIISWGYDRYGERDARDFTIGDIDRAGDVEEAANVVVEAVFDGDPERLSRAISALRRLGVPRHLLENAESVSGGHGGRSL